MKKRDLLTGLLILGTTLTLASCSLSGTKVPDKQNSTVTISSEDKLSTEVVTKYNVTFDTKGGSMIASQTIEKNGKVEKPADPTKEGFTFVGWYLSEYYIFEYNFSSNVIGDMTLYAKWKEIPKVQSYEVGTPTIDIWTDSIYSRWMKVAIPVTNNGETNLYLDDISVDIEDVNGKLLQTKSYISGYPEYIKPGETGYYYDETTCDFAETNVKVVPNLHVEKAKNDVIRYNICDVSINNDTYSGVKIIGRVQNNTTTKGTLVKVVANLFDKDGKLICNCFTYLDNDLEVDTKVGFSISPFAFRNVKAEDVASYEIYAYPQQFNI